METGTALCGAEAWTARIGDAELASILSARNAPARSGLSIRIDDHTRRVSLRSGGELLAFPAEDFRLRVNRRKGWNFLKSNDYRVETVSEEGESVFVFTGIGNGHGAGLCQRGAVELARRGFSRYEILAHYYPGVRFPTVKKADGAARGFVRLFDRNRRDRWREPPGVCQQGTARRLGLKLSSRSTAAERPDLFDAYRVLLCRRAGSASRQMLDAGRPRETGIERALSHSCNLYLPRSIPEILENPSAVSSIPRRGACPVNLPPVRAGRIARHLAGLDYGRSLCAMVSRSRNLAPGAGRTRCLRPNDGYHHPRAV